MPASRVVGDPPAEALRRRVVPLSVTAARSLLPAVTASCWTLIRPSPSGPASARPSPGAAALGSYWRTPSVRATYSWSPVTNGIGSTSEPSASESMEKSALFVPGIRMGCWLTMKTTDSTPGTCFSV